MKSQEPPDEEYICRATIQDRVVAFHNFLHLFPFFGCFSFARMLSVFLLQEYYKFFFLKNIISLTGALIRLQLHSA